MQHPQQVKRGYGTCVLVSCRQNTATVLRVRSVPFQTTPQLCYTAEAATYLTHHLLVFWALTRIEIDEWMERPVQARENTIR